MRVVVEVETNNENQSTAPHNERMIDRSPLSTSDYNVLYKLRIIKETKGWNPKTSQAKAERLFFFAYSVFCHLLMHYKPFSTSQSHFSAKEKIWTRIDRKFGKFQRKRERESMDKGEKWESAVESVKRKNLC